MGGVAWSPAIQILRDKVELWILVMRRKRRVRTNLTKIRRLIKRTKCFNALRIPHHNVWLSLKAALKEYYDAKKTARSQRIYFLDDLATEMAENENIKVESVLKRIKNTEKTRQTFRRLHPFKKTKRETRCQTFYFCRRIKKRSG